jgi:type I restriction-modification system DNA methylase subunit
MPVPQSILDLVARFESQRAAYLSGRYNETELRRDFLDPFFEALGWDVRNVNNASERYRDVIHEKSVEIAEQAKSADYLFQVGGDPVFFVEAKKPSVNIETNPAPAFQLKSYARSKKLLFSILTDFEQLAFYECTTKPVFTQSPSLGRIALYHYRDYPAKWEEISARISRTAVTSGAFEIFVNSVKGKRGTTDVDDDFLAEMERWRLDLARNIALRNPFLSQREINFTVQTTIDRVIFLRICEDRGIEPEEGLKNATDGIDVYGDMLELFRKADKKYNSGLFHFSAEKGRFSSPDTLTPAVKIDDKVLKDILSNLYYPKSPYAFKYFSADILGQVYERFLGKVITLSAGHRADVQEKPEVRKAGGVYYTPTYIVDYIVKNTVGELLKDKTPESLKSSPLRVLDPACGSGSFLLGAYQFLMDWYLDWFVTHDPARYAKGSHPAVIETLSGWQLTLEKKKDILTSHIYGVDIDSQAVEVTKLSLLLKVVENPGQLSLYEERILPDLGENIKCGNSLIGPDFYDGQQGTLFDSEEQYRVNAFDWHTAFPRIFKDGGFDAVIGNPPWGAELSEEELDYFRKHNSTIIVRMIDTFMYFVFQIGKKLTQGGFFGMILPDVFLYQVDNAKLRFHVLSEYQIQSVLNMGNVFEKVTRPSSILITKKSSPKNSIKIQNLAGLPPEQKSLFLHDRTKFTIISQSSLLDIPNFLFITENPNYHELYNKIRNSQSTPLSDYIDNDGIQRGVSPDLKDAFIVNGDCVRDDKLETEKLRKVLTGGRQVKRYSITYPDFWLLYISEKDNINKYPNIKKHIEKFKEKITCKEVETHKHSLYSLHRPRQEHVFLKDRKAIGVITEDELVVAIDDKCTFVTDGLYLFGVKESLKLNYVVAILNSKLMKFLYRLVSNERGRVLAQVKPTVITQLPIHKVDFGNSKEVDQHDRLVALVETMLTLHKNLAAARLPDEQERLQRRIAATDRAIDTLVYQLYDLTPEEIAIVEGA